MADILVIEDDQRIRELVCRHLAGEGYGVTSESTGLDGLRTLTADPPDALVLDLGLPDLDGLDLLKMIRAKLVYSPPAKTRPQSWPPSTAVPTTTWSSPYPAPS